MRSRISLHAHRVLELQKTPVTYSSLRKEINMNVQSAVRLLAGMMILISLGLAHWVSMNWLLLTAIVGINLLQSSFTNWCPAMSIFRWMGLRDISVP